MVNVPETNVEASPPHLTALSQQESLCCVHSIHRASRAVQQEALNLGRPELESLTPIGQVHFLP